MKELLTVLAFAFVTNVQAAEPVKKPAKPVVTKKATTAKKSTVKAPPPKTSIRPVVKKPQKVTRKATITKKK